MLQVHFHSPMSPRISEDPCRSSRLSKCMIGRMAVNHLMAIGEPEIDLKSEG